MKHNRKDSVCSQSLQIPAVHMEGGQLTVWILIFSLVEVVPESLFYEGLMSTSLC